MTRQAETLLQQALTLDERERAKVAGALLESLEPEAEADVEAAWRQEVAARIADQDSSGLNATPWEEVRDEILARLSERSAG